MRIASLRVRLLIAAAMAIAVALILSGLLLARLFVQHVEDRVAAELQTHLNQIAAGLELNGEGMMQLASAPADRRFFEPYSGLYWQLDLAGRRRQRSRSLWDFELVLPADELPLGSIHRHELPGPQRTTLFAVERSLTIDAGTQARPFRAIVAVDRREIDDAETNFRVALWKSLAVIGIALLAAFGAMLHVGWLPLRRLSAAVQDVHDGRKPTVDGTFPSEVQPLVSDMNRLLEQQRQSIGRAREQASDLAHGFKTPLAVLSAVARDLKRDGRMSSAAEIETQVDLMGRHVRRELARARTAGASTAAHGGTAVLPLVDKVLAAMRRIAGDRDLDWSVSGDANIRFAGDETDLLEIIGNLCENAGKWARTMVQVDVHGIGSSVDLSIDDDGPGIPDGTEVVALARGRRLDESAEGSGLGLAIVAKVVAACDGQIELSRSSLGGLRARVILPAAAANLTDK